MNFDLGWKDNPQKNVDQINLIIIIPIWQVICSCKEKFLRAILALSWLWMQCHVDYNMTLTEKPDEVWNTFALTFWTLLFGHQSAKNTKLTCNWLRTVHYVIICKYVIHIVYFGWWLTFVLVFIPAFHTPLVT